MIELPGWTAGARELNSFQPRMELIPLAGPLIGEPRLSALDRALESVQSIAHIGRWRPIESESVQRRSYSRWLHHGLYVEPEHPMSEGLRETA